jgi:hypothetical protein
MRLANGAMIKDQNLKMFFHLRQNGLPEKMIGSLEMILFT